MGNGLSAHRHNGRGSALHRHQDVIGPHGEDRRYLSGQRKGRCVAYWRPAHGSPERFLCAADADACRKHPHLRELLIELAAEVALNRKRAAGDSVALRVRAPISGRAGGMGALRRFVCQVIWRLRSIRA
jgi:hypothetical protein